MSLAKDVSSLMESVGWFPGTTAEQAMMADALVRDHSHALLSELIQKFPNFSEGDLMELVGKVEQCLAKGIARLFNPEPDPPPQPEPPVTDTEEPPPPEPEAKVRERRPTPRRR